MAYMSYPAMQIFLMTHPSLDLRGKTREDSS